MNRQTFDSTPFPRRTLVVGLVFALALGLAGCGSDDGPTAPGGGGGGGSATATIGAGGGTLNAPGDDFVLAIPAGALGADVTFTVARQSGDDVPADLAALGITESWNLEPAGTAFATPATLTMVLPTAKANDIPAAVAVTSTGDGVAPSGANVVLRPGDDGLLMLADVTITGPVATLYGEGAGARIADIPAEVPCGESFTGRAQYYIDGDLSGTSVNEVVWHDDTNSIGDNAISFDGSDGVVGAEGLPLPYSCDGTGPGVVVGRMVFDGFRPLAAFAPVTLTFDLSQATSCATCTGGGEFIGSRTSPITLPEAIVIIVRAWAASSQVEDFMVGVAGANGWGVIDVATGVFALDDFLDQFRTLFGIALLAAPMGTEKDSGYHEAVVDFGPNGAGITAYGAEGWGWTQLIEMQNPVYDATNFLGPLGDAGCVYVSSTAVRTLAWNETSQAFVGDGRVLTYGDFAESFDTLVSAVTDGPTDPVLIVEDRGVDAGRIWLHGRDGARATVVGSAGVSPRKVRAAGGVAVVSSFADDLLTVVLWDGGTSASVAGTVAVGDGPVGIDVMDLGNGTVAVVSTGFNDDTYTVTVLAAADGSVVSKTTHQVPEGGQEPGHAAWVRDGSRRIAISCHGSDEIVVLDSGL